MNQLGRYDHLSREALIALLERRDVSCRYGLVWERDGIEGDRAVNHDFVALDLDPCAARPRRKDARGWRNLVIEGDNWDALRALRLAYAGRVRCILIDPPYNTGSRDFAYNDRYVGTQDRYRQSLWLEFLYRRLVLARDLLAEDGVILVCINDENRARLDLLMEQVFPGSGCAGQFRLAHEGHQQHGGQAPQPGGGVHGACAGVRERRVSGSSAPMPGPASSLRGPEFGYT